MPQNVNIMKTKNKITKNDYLLANKKASREEEIFQHGHPIYHSRIHKSKKVYDRKKMKASDRSLPFFISSICGMTSSQILENLFSRPRNSFQDIL